MPFTSLPLSPSPLSLLPTRPHARTLRLGCRTLKQGLQISHSLFAGFSGMRRIPSIYYSKRFKLYDF